MTLSDYIDFMEKRYRAYFDISRNFTYKQRTFDLFAGSKVKNERYFGTKKAVVYSFENYEYSFLKYYKSLEEKNIEDITELLIEAIDDYVEPHGEHMSTYITGVIVTDQVNDLQIINKIKKFKYHKSFAFGFKGWVDIRLILVELNGDKVYVNRKAKDVYKFYQASGL